MKEINWVEGEFIKEEFHLLHNIPTELRKKLAYENVYIAGGAITSVFSRMPVFDYDLYFRDFDNYISVKRWFNNKMTIRIPEVEHIVSTDTADTYKYKDRIYQLICGAEFVNESITKVVGKFDFTVCMGIYSMRHGMFILHEDFIRHIAQRILEYNPLSEYPFASLIRTIKYQKKGYTITLSQMMRLALKTHSIPLDTLADLKKQLMGIDLILLLELWKSINPHEKYDFERFLQMLDNYIEENYLRLREEELNEQ